MKNIKILIISLILMLIPLAAFGQTRYAQRYFSSAQMLRRPVISCRTPWGNSQPTRIPCTIGGKPSFCLVFNPPRMVCSY